MTTVSRKIVLILMSLFLLSCDGSGDKEQSIKFHDPDLNARFMKALNEKNVPYRVTPDGQIFYSISQKAKINEASDEVLGPTDKSKKGAVVQKQDAAAIASGLTAHEIKFKVIHSPEESYFSWAAANDAEAMRVVSAVIRKREESAR